jgi:hypothetical protein
MTNANTQHYEILKQTASTPLKQIMSTGYTERRQRNLHLAIRDGRKRNQENKGGRNE